MPSIMPTSYTGVACGYEQVIGAMVMSAVVTFGTIGALVGAIIMMKLKADLRFKTTLVTVFRVS
jgi:hypothetical protein